jgi:hypothetical protein
VIERKLCPDCGGNLGKGATKCRCGWKAVEDVSAPESKPVPTCEVMADCPYPARLVVNGKRTCVVHHDEALRPAAEPV